MRSQERSDVLAEILLHDRGHLRVEHDLQPATADVPSHGALAVRVEVAAGVNHARTRLWPVRADLIRVTDQVVVQAGGPRRARYASQPEERHPLHVGTQTDEVRDAGLDRGNCD